MCGGGHGVTGGRGAAASDTVRVQWLEVLHGVCAKELSSAAEGHVRVASYRGCAVVWKVAGGVVLFLTGCGLYDEIARACLDPSNPLP